MSQPHLLYEPLERLRVPRPVDRIRYLQEAAKGKTVLDIGALDETAYDLKLNDGSWLHLALATVAKKVLGIDNSQLVPPEGLETSANSRILRLGIDHLDQIPDRTAFDLIIAGELIEHLTNAQAFLEALCSAGFRSGVELLITTPNATGVHNLMLAFANRESAHKDHLAVYSYKTLNTLCLRSGFQAWQIIPYYVCFTEMRKSSRPLARIGIRAAERISTAIAWIFPMLGGGWILRARI